MSDAPVAIVAGSGIALGPLLDTITWEKPFHDIFGVPEGHVAGHACKVLYGTCDGHRILLQCGRLHAYEGSSFEEVTRSVDVFKEMGVRRILFTNAAGGVRRGLAAGSLLAVNRVQCWPYRKYALPDVLCPDLVVPSCDSEGTYQWVYGPSYETMAEIAALQSMAADAVGMSTAPALFRCQQLGIASSVISCITNQCGASEKLTHAHVLETAQQASSRLCDIIRTALPTLGVPNIH